MQPLADLMRPTDLDEVAGQSHIIGTNGVLRRIIDTGRVSNMIFYGPPGIGKTTIASIIAGRTNRRLHKLNGTTASIADIKAIVDELDTFIAPGGVLLYLDEIQYFNKKQQQSLLEFMENGKITLIASTTENPYFYVYPAILSRSTVFEFKPLTPDEVMPVVERAFKIMSKELGYELKADEEVRKTICSRSGGDVRKAINAVELASLLAKDGVIALEDAEGVSQRSALRYDKEGDEHYDILSAFQKSIRGSDENAAMHYLARLIEAGDLPSICRRLLVMAAEDIGLAYPQAIMVTKACVDSALQLGLPEAGIPLAEAVILLATSPKSNSAVSALGAALADVQQGNIGDIPQHLKDAHYKGAAKMGRGLTYQYPHNFKNNWVKQQYLPDAIKDAKYYSYGENKMEQATKKYWESVKGTNE